jgi:hypothetical protein
MTPNRMTVGASVALAIACASVPPAPVPEPASAPASSPAQPASTPSAPSPAKPKPARGGAWAFAYAPGTYTYTLTTEAVIAPLSDSSQKRQLPGLNQKATITIGAGGDVQVVEPGAVTTTACDASAALTTRAQQLIPSIPAHLATGDHWRDSTTTNGCRGMIPAESAVISNYTVVGETTFANMPAVQIHRLDSLSARGEGSEGQHRISVTASGTGNTDLFLDVATGRLIGSSGLQSSLVNVTTSGRLAQFIQHVTEVITLAAQ